MTERMEGVVFLTNAVEPTSTVDKMSCLQLAAWRKGGIPRKRRYEIERLWIK